jgi:hypothetical protein
VIWEIIAQLICGIIITAMLGMILFSFMDYKDKMDDIDDELS